VAGLCRAHFRCAHMASPMGPGLIVNSSQLGSSGHLQTHLGFCELSGAASSREAKPPDTKQFTASKTHLEGWQRTLAAIQRPPSALDLGVCPPACPIRTNWAVGYSWGRGLPIWRWDWTTDGKLVFAAVWRDQVREPEWPGKNKLFSREQQTYRGTRVFRLRRTAALPWFFPAKLARHKRRFPQNPVEDEY